MLFPKVPVGIIMLDIFYVITVAQRCVQILLCEMLHCMNICLLKGSPHGEIPGDLPMDTPTNVEITT